MRGQSKKLGQVARHVALARSDDGVKAKNQFEASIIAAGAHRRAPAETHLWPCNLGAWGLWQELQTQWRVGMAGATGLDYTAVVAHLRASGLRGDAFVAAYEAIREAESETLAVWAEDRERAEQLKD